MATGVIAAGLTDIGIIGRGTTGTGAEQGESFISRLF